MIKDDWRQDIRDKFQEACVDFLNNKYGDYKVVSQTKVTDDIEQNKSFGISIIVNEKEMLYEFVLSNNNFELCNEFNFDTMVDEFRNYKDKFITYYLSYKEEGTKVLNSL